MNTPRARTLALSSPPSLTISVPPLFKDIERMHVQQGHHADSVGFIRKPHVAMSMLLLPVVRCKPDLTRIFSTGTESGPVVSKASRRVLLMVLAALSFIGCAREAFATSYSYTRVG